MPTKILVEIITVGYPFVFFKLISGYYWITSAPILGYILILWGGLDFLINSYNFFSYLFSGRSILRTCALNYLVKYSLMILPFEHVGERDLGTALDLFAAFCIVAIVIGAGIIGKLPPPLLFIWNIAVIFNVLGAGMMRLRDTSKRLRKKM